MKNFELPYNFSDDYFNKLSKCKKYFEYIKFIYLPAFSEESLQNTREIGFISGYNNKKYTIWENYVNVLKEIQSYNLDICILMQRNATLELIEKYINEFNVKYFIINDDNLAKTLKDKYKNNVKVILSITRKLTYEDILNTDLSMYDEIVLFFWFNRHLQYIKKLPKKYKYVVLANSNCAYNCKISDLHWWRKDFKLFRLCGANKDNLIYINPDDLVLFEKYVSSYKLLDRCQTSQNIMDSLVTYSIAYKNNCELKHNYAKPIYKILKYIKLNKLIDKNKEKHYCLDYDI